MRLTRSTNDAKMDFKIKERTADNSKLIVEVNHNNEIQSTAGGYSESDNTGGYLGNGNALDYSSEQNNTGPFVFGGNNSSASKTGSIAGGVNYSGLKEEIMAALAAADITVKIKH